MFETIISKDVNAAIQYLTNGEIIGIPTETVYGLAANAFNEKAVLKIFETKRRPSFDPLIVHTNSVERMYEFVKEIPDTAITLFKRFSPGPITILLNKKDNISDLVTSGHSTVALRIPDHPLTLNLLSALSFPLAAPSANPFGYISPTSTEHVMNQLGNLIPLILEGGKSKIGIESTIVGFEQNMPVIYRYGGISKEDIESVIGTIRTTKDNLAIAPGMLKSHYAPGKHIILGNLDTLIEDNKGKRLGILSYNKIYKDHICYVLSPSGNLKEAAINLFDYLRKLDEAPIDLIVADLVPDIGLGRAINDRLTKAAN